MAHPPRKSQPSSQTHRDDLPALMSVSEAAHALGLTRQGLWNAIKRGYVETVQSGPYTLVPRHAVERYAAQKRKPGRPPKQARKPL